MKKFSADFETAIWVENETWVWAWACVEIGNEENLQIGNNIDDFIEYLKNENNPTVYMHNLKFDRRICHLLVINSWIHACF